MEALTAVALDTNAYVAFCKGIAWSVDILRRAREIYLPIIVLAELRAGFACGNQKLTNERKLIAFLNSERVEILNTDESTTHHYARLYCQLRKQGTPIPMNDLWIAALAVQHDMLLLTGDGHFDCIPQLLRP